MIKLSAKAKRFLEENDLYMFLEQEDRSINSDDEPNYNQTKSETSDTEDNPDIEDNQDTEDDQTNENNTYQNMSPEDIMNQQIDNADSKFILMRLYDKIVNLQDMIKNLSTITLFSNEERGILENYKDYAFILNELIFSLDINVIYQLVGQLEIDLHEFLNNTIAKINELKNNQG